PCGKIHILVHNARHGDERFLEETCHFVPKIQDLTNDAEEPIFLTQGWHHHLACGSRIVVIFSASLRMGVLQQTVYLTTNAANEAMARVWATELGVKYGVTVNCAAPSLIATEMYYASHQGILDTM
ncbi:hypothetical protein BJ875DRAFT_381672, partial [Amylocarpus encephaloides]